MNKKLSQKELAALRKKQRMQREMQNSLAHSLKDAEKKQEDDERFYAGKSKVVIGIINLVGTIVIFEVLLFIAGFLAPIGIIKPWVRLFALAVGIISAFMKRSLVDGWINRA